MTLWNKQKITRLNVNPVRVETIIHEVRSSALWMTSNILVGNFYYAEMYSELDSNFGPFRRWS